MLMVFERFIGLLGYYYNIIGRFPETSSLNGALPFVSQKDINMK
jgi:hypothetical protein